jgi:hypothetical protein
MSVSCESRTVIVGHTINLDIRVLNALGQAVDADSTPMTQIKDGDGNIVRPLSASGVLRLDTGIYRLSYAVSAGANTGIWTDTWRAVVDGFTTDNNLTFIVLSASASIDVDGCQIGADPDITYTQAEICGINVLMQQLRCRLRDTKDIMKEAQDEYGNIVLENCPIWSDDTLLCFLRNSLSEFNQIPHFTNFSFADQVIWDRNAHVVVEGAYILALGAGMLVEAGREFTLTDAGITMQPPPLSTVMNNQFGALLSAHAERLKFIKCSMKPAPLGVGTFRVLAVSPAYLRLRHLRERQII